MLDFFKKRAKHSPTFCAYPWVEQVVQSSGRLSFCCVAQNGGVLQKDDGRDFLAAHDTLKTAWNSSAMKDIRKAMINGEKVEACKLCYYQESINKKSYRQLHNEEWFSRKSEELNRRVKFSQAHDFTVDEPALYLDLRLGNLCNLKCRSCNPFNSSQIFRETTALFESDNSFKNIWSKYFGHPYLSPLENWYEQDSFWDEVIESIPKLSKVYLTGGEPTLIEKNYLFLNECIRTGYAKNISLMFNTNCTNLQERFLKLIENFKDVLMNISIDGVGADNEYIRFLSRWETIDRNFKTLLQTPKNIRIGVTPVVQIYNILNITDLLKYIEELGKSYDREIAVDFLYATHPEFLDITALPESIKKIAAARLKNFSTTSTIYKNGGMLKNSVDSCINALEKTPDAVSPEKINDFLKYTASLDTKRNQSFEKSFPELSSLLLKEGYSL